jgi:hypothetical protein
MLWLHTRRLTALLRHGTVVEIVDNQAWCYG